MLFVYLLNLLRKTRSSGKISGKNGHSTCGICCYDRHSCIDKSWKREEGASTCDGIEYTGAKRSDNENNFMEHLNKLMSELERFSINLDCIRTN